MWVWGRGLHKIRGLGSLCQLWEQGGLKTMLKNTSEELHLIVKL